MTWVLGVLVRKMPSQPGQWELLTIAGPCGVNAEFKAGCLVAGMAADADSIGHRRDPAARRERVLGPQRGERGSRGDQHGRAAGSDGIMVVRAGSAFCPAAFTAAWPAPGHVPGHRQDDPGDPGGDRWHRR